MELKPIDEVKTADEARQIAIEWQNTFGEKRRSWGDLLIEQDYFRAIVSYFPELKDEFEENGII